MCVCVYVYMICEITCKTKMIVVTEEWVQIVRSISQRFSNYLSCLIRVRLGKYVCAFLILTLTEKLCH